MSTTSSTYRTHTCGQLRAADVGQTVTLAGWVGHYRDHGNLAFIDLRDRAGVTQVTFDADLCGKGVLEQARRLRGEWCVGVEGEVVRRTGKQDEAKTNEKLPTGDVEVMAKKLVVHSESPTPPFNLDEADKVNEELRLEHRYLDLRRPKMQETLAVRSRMNKIVRDVLVGEEGFLEVETPCLTRATPEGARDFIVPARLVPGSFYALPQSPQIFKQLLMVGGCDKYMQIARCFRDEDPRADRQAEFTQLDLEMSFVDEADVQAAVEKVVRRVWKEVLGKDVPDPIPHMPYDEAMRDYGSDRPDLRFGMKLVDVTDLAKKTDFRVFSQAPMVKAICLPGGASMTRKETDALADWAKGFGAGGMPVTKVEAGGLATGVAKFLEPIASDLVARTGAADGDLLCFAADRPKTVHKVLGELRLKLAKDQKIPPSAEFAWVWVDQFPAFEHDEDKDTMTYSHHPFTMVVEEDLPKLDSADRDELLKIKTKAYDLVVNGSELGGGSIRIHDYPTQKKVLAALGIDDERQEKNFGFLLEGLKFGAPPHGGIALGLDRVVMLLRGVTNIRDVIAFPKTQTGLDLMCDAPAAVDDKQLAEAHIRVAEQKPENVASMQQMVAR